MINYHSGYDWFSTKPGSTKEILCRVCNNILLVEQNVVGASSSIEAMSGRKHVFDKFYCQFAGELWHQQALELVKDIEQCPSKYLSELMEKELKEILEIKKTTKEFRRF